jgi:prepilin-type N-terminal cleavage/methylation domain-containing protein
MAPSKNGSQGFTLIELMLSLAIAGVALLVICSFFIAQSENYTIQNQLVDLQRDLRVGMLSMEGDLRQTGYNPGGLTEERADVDGVDNDCDGSIDETDNDSTVSVDESEAIGFKVALVNRVTVSVDKNGDGSACGDKESITYRLNGTYLERNVRPLFANVEVLNFVYLNKNGVVASSTDAIRSVQIAIIGRTKREDPEYNNAKSYFNLQGDEILAAQNDGYRRRMLTSQVYCRNLDD